MAVCRITWPYKSDVLINAGLWTSMEELQIYIRELGKKEAIYDDAFQSPDLVKFDGDEGPHIRTSSSPPVWHTGVRTEPLSGLRGHHPTGCPIDG